LIIAPIGNLGAGRSLSPGDYHGVLSVGAVDREGMVTTFSGSYHPYCQQTCMKPDVLAPGADILVARPGGGYQEVSGTSIACALVAGIAALLMQAAPSAPLSLIEDALVNTSMPLPLHKIHRSRRGLIQPEAALHYVLANQTRLQLSTTDYNSESSSYNPLVRSYKYIDPRLQKIFRYASNDYILEAVFIIASTAEVADNQDPRGAAGEVIDRVTRAQGEKPERIRYIAAANIAIVLAKAAYLRMLIDDPQVQVTSATDIDKFLV
jgi:subtilisin family serine protease